MWLHGRLSISRGHATMCNESVVHDVMGGPMGQNKKMTDERSIRIFNGFSLCILNSCVHTTVPHVTMLIILRQLIRYEVDFVHLQ